MRRDRLKPVLLLHGIRTDAKWQKAFGDELSADGFEHHTYDFGNFSLFRFALSWSRKRKVDDFYNWYCGIRDKTRRKRNRDFRPSVVAHSFGCYIIGQALKKYQDITIGRLILCGSILPRDFEWTDFFARNQLCEVINDYGIKDGWSRCAQMLVPDAGSSGAEGFTVVSPLVRNRRFEYHGHSDFFLSGHFGQWKKILGEPLVEFRTIRSSELPPGTKWADISVHTRAIDALVYTGLEGYERVALPEGLSGKWLEINPDLYTILVDQVDKVHGYINAMPLNRQAFDEVVEGKRPDNAVTVKDIVTYTKGVEVDLYLMSIAIHPDSRNLAQGLDQSAFHRLLFGLTHRLEVLAREHGVLVNRMGAIGWTEEGNRLCKIIGLRPYVKDEFGHPTYMINLKESDAELRSHRLIRELLRVYTAYR